MYSVIDSIFVKIPPEAILYNHVCDAVSDNCPPGYICIKFDKLDEAICAVENPCEYYKCPGFFNDCVVMESYPLRVGCR